MKITMQFSLPDEADEYRHSFDGDGMATALRVYEKWLLSQARYGGFGPEATEAYNRALSQLSELLDEQGVSSL